MRSWRSKDWLDKEKCFVKRDISIVIIALKSSDSSPTVKLSEQITVMRKNIDLLVNVIQGDKNDF